MYENSDHVLDPVLSLPVYCGLKRQYIYGLPALQHDTMYMVDIPGEPDLPPDDEYMLECTWGVAYL